MNKSENNGVVALFTCCFAKKSPNITAPLLERATTFSEFSSNNTSSNDGINMQIFSFANSNRIEQQKPSNPLVSNDWTISTSSSTSSSSTKSITPAEWTVCHHGINAFNVVVFHNGTDAREYYSKMIGSKLLACNDIIVTSLFTKPLWKISLHQYWSLYRRRDALQQQYRNRPHLPMNLFLFSDWSLCYHHHDTGFHCEVLTSESEARLAYNQCDTRCTRLFGQGSNIIEEWHSNEHWRVTVAQYWELYIDWYNRMTRLEA
jgi:hypothetical protein